MNIIVSIAVSALMVLGSMFYSEQAKTPALGASQTISSLTSYTPAVDTDVMPIVDTTTATTKKITWANVKATLKTYQDTLYSPIFSTSAGLSALLSDETGSGGGIVRATGPTISGAQLTSTPTLTDPVLNGTITGTGVVGIAQGGTGSTTKASAFNALLPIQTGFSGKSLVTDGTNSAWTGGAVPTSVGYGSSTVLVSDGSDNFRWYAKESCKVYIDVGNLSNSVGRTYVNINHDFRSTSTIVRADWSLSESTGTASSNWGHGIGTTTATSSNFAISTYMTAASSGLGGGNNWLYLIHADLDDKIKLLAWVNYMSATNTQLAWDIRATDSVNSSVTIEVCP